MALDGILLHKIVSELKKEFPLRIQKIWDVSGTEILFQVRTYSEKKNLLVSCHSVYNRLLFTERSYTTPAEPSNFVMVLRKYLEGAIMDSIEQAALDRWCSIAVTRRNNLGDLEKLTLYIELLGNYANIILVNSDNRIIDALKRIPPFENSRRTVFPGAEFTPIEPQNKKDPFSDMTIDTDRSLTAQFGGFSPFLSKETEYRMRNGESFSSIMKEISESECLYIANQNNEPVFHCIEIKSAGLNKSYPLFEGFDILYYHREEKDRIRQASGDLFHFASRQLKHQNQKLPRLLSELDAAKNCEQWRLYGDLLYTYQIRDTKGQSEIELTDYESDQPVRIPLDPKLDGSQNARRCYQKYNKLKKGQQYLQEQITICENEIHYFEGILEQLEQADVTVAEEIHTELISQGYLKNTQKKRPKRKKDQGPSVTSVTLSNTTSLSFGRNNLQNDALTWHKARKNETWLHAKDYHGAHVVLHTEHPSEEELRTAANIAAYFSKGRNSSSVPVVYCPVRNLKKIPGAKPGMVQLGAYKMIYIDPDEEEIASLGLL